MKKRILALLLTVTLIISMTVLPAYALEAEADTTQATELCPCGCGLTLSQITWQPWNVNETGDPENGHYYLDGDYVQDGQVTVMSGNKVVLDLRGHTITTSGYSRIALVYGNMAVLDTVGGGCFSSKTSDEANGGVIMVAVNETPDPSFQLCSGTLTQDPDSENAIYGGLIYISTGSIFKMTGGSITGGTASKHGGAIYAATDTSVIEITGGSIIGCYSGNCGGSIYAKGPTTLENCQLIGGTAASWGGNIYLTGESASLTAKNCVFRHGVSNCSVSTNNNGGGNICCLSSSTSSLTDCTVTGGYSAKNGGNLYLGSGNHTVTGGTVSTGTAGLSGSNIYGTGNVTLDGCTVPGDVEYNNTGKLTLKGAVKIGLLSTGLNIANNGAQVDASGLTEGAQIYLNADGVTLENAGMDYFLPAIRTTLTEAAGSITASYAADGEVAGYCPHCDSQVAWSAFGDSAYVAECLNDSTDDTDTACTNKHLETGHYYLTESLTGVAQQRIGDSVSKLAKDVVIDLNGKSLTASSRAIYIYTGASLSLLDSAGGGKVTGKGVSSSLSQGGGVVYNDNGDLNIYGGTYYCDYDATRGLTKGGVLYNSGVTNIHGGTLDGSAYSSSANNGGAVCCADGAAREINMSAGHIIGGSAENGGSICFGNNNIVSITGGSITGGDAAANGGNIYVDGTKAESSASVSISGCAITDGTLTKVDDVTIKGGGNVTATYSTLELTDCYIAGGNVGSATYAGNILCTSGGTITVKDSIVIGGYATRGGNVYSAGTTCTLNLIDSLITQGEATQSAGNIHAGNGYITIDGCTVSFGTAGSYGGNINASAGNASATSANYTTITGNTQFVGGTAGTYGGNIYANGVLNLDSAFVSSGKAATSGQDIYLASFGKQQKLTVGSGVAGEIMMFVEESSHLTAPIFGTAIAYTACDRLNATIYLENEGYGLPELIAEGGALKVGAIAVVAADGSADWYTTPEEAMAAYTEGSFIRLALDCELTLTQDCIVDVCGSTITVSGDYKVWGMDTSSDDYTDAAGSIVWASADAVNTEAVTYAPNGNTYIALTDGNTVTYHRLSMGITSMSVKPSADGIYYSGKWSCDEVLAAQVENYGIIASLEGMPTAQFATEDNGNLWTEMGSESFESGSTATSVVIDGIMQSEEAGRTQALNDRYGKMPIYAATYITFKDGSSYVSDQEGYTDDVSYSLYDAMTTLDSLITGDPITYRHYTNTARSFYEKWKDLGMNDWSFNNICSIVEDDVIDVLMIGSSFCYYYVEELASLADAAGLKMRVCNVYYSGGKLYQHYGWWVDGESKYQFFETTVTDNGISRVKTTGVSLEWCLAQGQWDVISLQEHTVSVVTTGASEHQQATRQYYEPLFSYFAEQFPEAQLCFQQTWAYQPGYNSGFQMVDTEQQTSDAAILKAYAEAVCADLADLGVKIVPSGSAWQQVRIGAFGDAYDNLCARIAKNAGVGDYYHEGDIGGAQYLNACVWFEVITGLDCRQYDSYIPFYEATPLADSVVAAVNVDTVEGGYALTQDFVNVLQECAHEAVAQAYAEDTAQ